MHIDVCDLKPLNVSSLGTQIVEHVRDAIFSGAFKRGQRLAEMVIAERLKVSRAPIREALSALECEGLVVNIPRRGGFVVDFSDKDIEEIYSLRGFLELGALRRAIGRFSADDLERLQELVDHLGTMVENGGGAADTLRLDLVFHETIVRVADHGRMYSVWNSMRWQTQLLIGLTSKTHSNHPEEPREVHQSILNAICNQDRGAAETILQEHIPDAQPRAMAAMHALGTT
jgi:DNA-binding GntR family transcriptional regulator